MSLFSPRRVVQNRQGGGVSWRLEGFGKVNLLNVTNSQLAFLNGVKTADTQGRTVGATQRSCASTTRPFACELL